MRRLRRSGTAFIGPWVDRVVRRRQEAGGELPRFAAAARSSGQAGYALTRAGTRMRRERGGTGGSRPDELQDLAQPDQADVQSTQQHCRRRKRSAAAQEPTADAAADGSTTRATSPTGTAATACRCFWPAPGAGSPTSAGPARPPAPSDLPAERRPVVGRDVHGVEPVPIVVASCAGRVARRSPAVSSSKPTMWPRIEKMPCCFSSRQAS